MREIRDYGTAWNSLTDRPVYLNYCVEGVIDPAKAARLKDLFSPYVFHLTFSVICSADESMKTAGTRQLDAVQETASIFAADGL